jgi:hypothetical protein
MDSELEAKKIGDVVFEYVGLKAQVRALQHEMAVIYPDVLRELKSSDVKREVGGAIVSIRKRETYKYSDQVSWIEEEIKERKEALKIRKKKEVESGVAEIDSVKESVFVIFKKHDGDRGIDDAGTGKGDSHLAS